MKNEIFEKNVKALQDKISGCEELIREKINGKILDAQSQIEVVQEHSYQGEVISAVRCHEKKYYLAGKYHPEGTARRQSEKIETIDFGTVVFVVGLGDGRALRNLTERAKEGAVILVYEPSLELFVHILQYYDLTDLLKEKSIIWFIDEINEEEISVALSTVVSIDNITKVKPFIMGNYEQLFPVKVGKAISILQSNLTDLRVRWNTMMNLSKETIQNNIWNSKYLYYHYSINQLYNILPENVPVIVVAAGPSLDKNIDLLAEAKGKACIIACDTALKPLLKRDIVPDFFVVVDARKPLELFEEPRIQQIPMISGINIPLKVMQQHKGKKFLYLDEWFEQEILKYAFGDKLEEHPMGSVPTGGSVATNAFSIGRMMGAKNIILVGQDLALSGEREHASGTFANDRKIEKKKEGFQKVQGINGEMLPTLFNLKLYLDWFEKQIEEYKEGLQVIDATEGGALIHGSRILSLREAIDNYCCGNFEADKYLKDMQQHFTDKERVRVLEFFHHIPERMEEIQKKITKGKSYYKQLQKCAECKTYKLEEIKKLLKKIKKVSEELDKDAFVVLLTEGIKNEEYVLRAAIYKFQEDEQQNIIESAKIGKVFLEKLEMQLKEVEPALKKLSEFQGEYEC